jgi:hypothetical protein
MADAINVCVWYVRKGIFHPVVFKPLRPPVGAQDNVHHKRVSHTSECPTNLHLKTRKRNKNTTTYLIN